MSRVNQQPPLEVNMKLRGVRGSWNMVKKNPEVEEISVMQK